MRRERMPPGVRQIGLESLHLLVLTGTPPLSRKRGIVA